MASLIRCDGCGKQAQPTEAWPARWISVSLYGDTEDDDPRGYDACSIRCAQHVLELADIINGP